jgi:hypothetical protein
VFEAIKKGLISDISSKKLQGFFIIMENTENGKKKV